MLAGFLSVASASLIQSAGTIGDGAPDNCTEGAFGTALVGGGAVSLNHRPAPHTIPLTTAKVIAADTQIESAGLSPFTARTSSGSSTSLTAFS